MWICLNDSFVSIVEDYFDNTHVHVRGRRESDVVNFLRNVKSEITKTDERDYRFRAYISKTVLAKILADSVDKINYTNFKDSVVDENMSKMYTEFWVSGVNNLDPGWIYRQEMIQKSK